MDSKNDSHFLTEIEHIKQVEFQFETLAIAENSLGMKKVNETQKSKK
jgi:hypothetical protein